eukprot:5551964-Amphidinium_carterae.1
MSNTHRRTTVGSVCQGSIRLTTKFFDDTRGRIAQIVPPVKLLGALADYSNRSAPQVHLVHYNTRGCEATLLQ